MKAGAKVHVAAIPTAMEAPATETEGGEAAEISPAVGGSPMDRGRGTDGQSACVPEAQQGPGWEGRRRPWTVKGTIELSEKEEEIFGTLLGAAKMHGLSTQLRVAGGWVRDKLLGLDCYDIDIALDDILGREFAEKVNQYLTSKGEVARGVGVIRCNPEQSKHLETATMMIHGQWVDLVNLRAEAYADQGSRIPSAVEFGTAEQDALRRDLTVNALFYNINTREVEDLAGRGMEDLKRGVIRTPLPPMQTFLDDPLRVLRAVRFASRFGFEVDPDLESAASNAEVHVALASKVSRERVGKELSGMLRGRDPLSSVQLLCSLGLFRIVFALPQQLTGTPQAGSSSSSACGASFTKDLEDEGVGCLERAVQLMVARPDTFVSAEMEVGAEADADVHKALEAHLGEDLLVSTYLAAILLPLRNFQYKEKKKELPVSQFVVRESLKLKASIADTVGSLHQHAEAFQAVVPLLAHLPDGGHGKEGEGEGRMEQGLRSEGNEIQEPGEDRMKEASERMEESGNQSGLVAASPFASHSRVQAGKLLRKAKASWRSALLLCALLGPSGGLHADPAFASLEQAARAGSDSPLMGVSARESAASSGRVNGERADGAGLGKRLKVHEQSGGSASVHPQLTLWEQKCVHASRGVAELGLEGVWNRKPLVNGKDVIHWLKLGKGSPQTGTWLERAQEWQLAHPEGTVNECRLWLESQHGATS